MLDENYSMKDAPQLLRGVVGSHAYGLNHADSDVDRAAVGVMPTSRFLGLNPPAKESLTYHSTSDEYDVTVHEVGKFVNLVAKANPTVTELLWLDGYEHATDLGLELVSNRERLLGSKSVHDAYYGYAVSQAAGAKRDKSESKREKYGRHLYRLVVQGTELWKTGVLRVRLTPEEAEAARAFGRETDPNRYDPLLEWMREEFEKPTPLPEHADMAWANEFVTKVRYANM